MTKKIKLAWWLLEAIADKQSDRFVTTGGYGSAKSFNSWFWLIERMRENPECPVFCYAEPVHHLIKSVAIPTFQAVADIYGFKLGVHYEINRSTPAEIIFKTNPEQRIRLISAQNPDVIIGFSSGATVGDEAGKYKQQAHDNLIARTRNNKMKYKNQVLFPTTPEGINYLAELYDSDTLAGWNTDTLKDHLKEFIEPNTKTPIRYRRFRTSTFENTYNPASYLANLFATYGHNQGYIRSYVYGYFAPFAFGLAAECYKASIHDFKEKVDALPENDIILTWDFNANPLSWLAISEMTEPTDQSSYYVVHEESSLGYSQIIESCIEFSVKFPVEKYGGTPIKVYGDRSGYSKTHMMKGDSYDLIAKSLKDLGYCHVELCTPRQVILESDAIDAANRLFYENICFLNPHLKGLKRSFSMTKLKTNERKIEKPSGEDWSHPYDAFKYFAYQVHYKEKTKHQKIIRGFN